MDKFGFYFGIYCIPGLVNFAIYFVIVMARHCHLKLSWSKTFDNIIDGLSWVIGWPFLLLAYAADKLHD